MLEKLKTFIKGKEKESVTNQEILKEIQEHDQKVEENFGEFMKRFLELSKKERRAIKNLNNTDEKILKITKKGEKRSCEVAKELGKTHSYISRRMNTLVEKNLLDKVKKGKKVFYKS